MISCVETCFLSNPAQPPLKSWQDISSGFNNALCSYSTGYLTPQLHPWSITAGKVMHNATSDQFGTCCTRHFSWQLARLYKSKIRDRCIGKLPHFSFCRWTVLVSISKTSKGLLAGSFTGSNEAVTSPDRIRITNRWPRLTTTCKIMHAVMMVAAMNI